jgi:hypothetical protein
MAKASEVEGSLIGQMDAANRKWARNTGKELNRLYTVAYGSNGTDADKDRYLEYQGNAMANIKVLGTNATFVANNQKVLNSTRNAKQRGSKNAFLLADNYNYDEGGEAMYLEASNYGSKKYKDWEIKTNDKGHLIMTAEGMEPQDLNAKTENYLANGGKDLGYYQIGETDLIGTHSLDKYNKVIKPLLEEDIKKEKVTDYDPATRTWTTTSSVTYASLEELEQGNKALSNQITNDLDNDTKMFKWWKQMQMRPAEEGGVQGLGELSDLPWQFLNSQNDDQLKKLISGQEGYTAFNANLDVDGTQGTDDQPREFGGFQDPTPSGS